MAGPLVQRHVATSPTRYTLSALAAAAAVVLCTSCSSGSQLAGSPDDGSTTTASTSVSTVIVVTTTADPRALAVQFEGITEPVAVGASGRVTWSQVAAESDVPKTVSVPAIPGFTPMGSPVAIPLDDGRVLVVGQSGRDAPIAARYRRNPSSLAPGLPAPEWTEEAQLPVRLFVYDPGGDGLVAVSGIPETHDYATAVSEGTTPDAVLEVRVLPGGRLVAYSVGFRGAGYDSERDIFIAPIPLPA